MRVPCVLLAGILAGLSVNDARGAPSAQQAAGDDWPYYFGNPAGTHYSRLSDINTSNVAQLAVAWSYDTGDKLVANSTIESNPLVVGGRLFFISANGRLISLDASTGRERWIFDPGAGAATGVMDWRRGVSYWRDTKNERIFFTFRDDLYAVDANTGLAIPGFGSRGHVSLGDRVSSPGVVYKDLIIVGGGLSSIRSFDIHSGKLRWTFHTIPRPGEFGYNTWPRDAWKTATGANNWAGMTLDAARGIVFVPLAAAYGVRSGDNLFANSLVALDASTGRRLWHFQTIRHDACDRDLPAPPVLITVHRDGKVVEAVAQVSKVGFIYLLDRLTGHSLFPLVEKPAIPSTIPGESAARTQIEPERPAPFTRQRITSETLTRRTPQAAAAVATQFATLSSRGLWDPPSERGTVLFASIDGGAEWGGAAFDPETGLLYVNSNEVAWILKLKKHSLIDGNSGGALYRKYCSGCHGERREGRPPEIPLLVSVTERLDFHQIATKIARGGGHMPAFPALSSGDNMKLWALIDYLRTGVDTATEALPSTADTGQPSVDTYELDGELKFIDPDGYPGTSPPWGTLNAVDLDTGQYAWRIAFGEYPELVAQGLKDTGSENYGGPIVTAGGLLFIGASSFDNKFRVYDKRTGRLLWETILPAAGNSTPATYRAQGRQFVVIAAGGGRPAMAATGSKIIAFALPR